MRVANVLRVILLFEDVGCRGVLLMDDCVCVIRVTLFEVDMLYMSPAAPHEVLLFPLPVIASISAMQSVSSA